MCDQIAIIDKGSVVACDETSTLLRRLDEKTLTITLDRSLDTLPPNLASHGAELQPDGRILVRYRPSMAKVGDVLEAVRQSKLTIADLATSEADLEELFIRLTGKSAES